MAVTQEHEISPVLHNPKFFTSAFNVGPNYVAYFLPGHVLL